MILIIDNHSSYTETIELTLNSDNVEYKLVDSSKRIDWSQIKDVDGVILTGGNLGAYSKKIHNDFVGLFDFDVPIIGFCLGHEIIGVTYGGMLNEFNTKFYKTQEIIIDAVDDPIFKNLKNKIQLEERHRYYISTIPHDFIVLAHSDVCSIEAMKHKSKPIYSFQSHPEISGETGQIIIRNFIEIIKNEKKSSD